MRSNMHRMCIHDGDADSSLARMLGIALLVSGDFGTRVLFRSPPAVNTHTHTHTHTTTQQTQVQEEEGEIEEEDEPPAALR